MRVGFRFTRVPGVVLICFVVFGSGPGCRRGMAFEPRPCAWRMGLGEVVRRASHCCGTNLVVTPLPWFLHGMC